MIGKITRVPLRKVWKHEALDFTTWMEDNIDVVNDILDLNLSNAEREQSAGKFSVDIVAEDDKGNPVIIENQLEKSNHDHLGKLITYLTSVEAKTAIWIVADPRPEHIRAISWLNESSSASFYMLKIEAIQIGDSEPAPLLTLIVGPTEEARNIGEIKKEWSERHVLRHRWWTQLLNYAKTKTKLHANRSPSVYHWIGSSAGKKGLVFVYSIRQKESTIELYIDRGKEAGDENIKVFDTLFGYKDEVEKTFGEPIEWLKMEGKRACRITKKLKGGYRDPEDEWAEIHKRIVDSMIRFHKAINPYIKKLKI